MKRSAIAAAITATLALAPAALAAGPLSGKYKTNVSGERAFGGALNGTWIIDFKKGASYKVSDNGTVVIRGLDSVKADKITFHDKTGPDACQAAGTYRFKLTGRKLTFTVISDPPACAGRTELLKHRFTKAS